VETLNPPSSIDRREGDVAGPAIRVPPGLGDVGMPARRLWLASLGTARTACRGETDEQDQQEKWRA
jgi:hypothetical protein